MSTVRELHDTAMRLAQDALVARERGDHARAASLAGEAVPAEIEAAERVAKTPASEPTRSILYRSAASLAYQANDFALAQRLVFEGLSGWPSPHVEDELKQLYEQINLAYHLKVRDVVLDGSQIQMSLAGDEVGSGQIGYRAFQDRIHSLITMLDRTTRRFLGQAYQRGGKAPEKLKPFIPLISTPRIGSFAVTIELAHRAKTTSSYFATGPSVIDEVVSGVQLVQSGDIDRLGSRINDESYFVNFLSLAQTLAPDGESVTMVGLTSPRQDVSFTREKSEVSVLLPLQVPVSAPKAEPPRTITGVLDEASARGNGRIGFTTETGDQLTLQVREGMDDLVRTFFNRRVRISTSQQGSSRTIDNITELEDE